jgi:hypothetical protein
MSSEFLKEMIASVVYLIPLLTLVYKGGKMSARIESIEKENQRLSAALEDEKSDTDTSIATILQQLSQIQQSIVRIETKLESEK